MIQSANIFFRTLPKTHDLVKLLKDCIPYDSTFAQLRDGAMALLPYATYTRYPDDRFNIDRKEVVQAIRHAENILKFVKTKIKPIEQSPQRSLFES